MSSLAWRPPILETERLYLRPLDENDADAVFAYAGNPNMTHYTLWETHRSRDDSLLFVRDYAYSRYCERVPEPLGMTLRERPDWVIGSLGCFWVSKPNAIMELGYALSERYWGQGLVVEAARVLLDYTFTEYPVERMQARVVVENRASHRVLQKLGFVFEGNQRAALFRRGKFWDVAYYSVLRAEWEQLRGLPPSMLHLV